MGNGETVIEYVQRYGGVSLEEWPLGDVDSLALCQLAYLKFDGIVPGPWENRAAMTLEDIYQHERYEALYGDRRFAENNRRLFEAMCASRRFRGLRLQFYLNLVKKELETQFCAVTYLLEDGAAFVAFRGTDETIVGWKEDFNMAIRHPVPCQVYCVQYLNLAASRLDGDLYVGGHSKGGNLAVYASMYCTERVRGRIRKIYSMDGPGILPEALRSSVYRELSGKIVKILPRTPFVGMLYESRGREGQYQTVECNRRGLIQHDPYTWRVKAGQFVLAKDRYRRSGRMNKVVNPWLLSQGKERLQRFVDALYLIVDASGAEDVIGFMENWRQSVKRMAAAYKGLDRQTLETVKEVLWSFLSFGRKAGTRGFETFAGRRRVIGKRFAREKSWEKRSKRLECLVKGKYGPGSAPQSSAGRVLP